MARLRVCAEPGCPDLSDGRRCPTCTAQRERARGTRQARGYGKDHLRLRGQWERKVLQCDVKCARCDQLILPDAKWHLDHNDDRTGYLGPSHERCNTSAGGKAAHH